MFEDVILTQKREIEMRLQEPYVKRDLDPGPADHDLIRAILGPRRAGKSFFAMHLVKELGPFGYVNFDDERLASLEDYDGLIAAVDAVFEHPRQLLLDEVQNLARWELLVNRLQRQGYRLIVTGSNAHLLSSELATHLTGRHLLIVLFPFGFAESLRIQNRDMTDAEKGQALRAYAESGGYPEPLLKNVPRREYLATLLHSVLYKDIVVRHRIRTPQGLDDLASWLMANVAQRCSLNTLAQVTRLTSVHTVDKYLRHLEEAFLFFSVRRFSFKVREQVRANRKMYCIDNGLVTSAAFRVSAEAGKLCENLVAVALHRQRLAGRLELFYWQGSAQEEVDFVVKQGTRVTRLIQVCLDPEAPKARARESRALLKASAELDCKDLLVLTESKEGQEEASWYGTQGTIRYQPLWKWLLAEGAGTMDG
jgi:hypothetical protein